MDEYQNTRRVAYDCDINGTAVFVPHHENCGLFVKADATIAVGDDTGLKEQPNATCKKHGRVEMLFEGFL